MAKDNSSDPRCTELNDAEQTELMNSLERIKQIEPIEPIDRIERIEHVKLSPTQVRDMQEREWIAKTEELQSPSIEELLKKRDYVQAALQLERSLIAGERVSREHLNHLPVRYGRNSPFIMQEIASNLLHRGMLSEAKQAAQQAVKGFATLYMPQPLLASLSLVGRIKLLMGEYALASVIVEQLRREFEEQQKLGNCDGDMARCLALGKLLLPQPENVSDGIKEIQAITLYQAAIHTYINEEKWHLACQVMAELAWHAGNWLDDQNWDWLHLQCLTVNRANQELSPYTKVLKLIEKYYKQHWWNMFLLEHESINEKIDINFATAELNTENECFPYWLRALKLLLVFSCATGMQSTALEQLAETKLARQERGQATMDGVRRSKECKDTLHRNNSALKNVTQRLQTIVNRHEEGIKACIAAYPLDVPLQYELITSLLAWNKGMGREMKELVQQKNALENILKVTSSEQQQDQHKQEKLQQEPPLQLTDYEPKQHSITLQANMKHSSSPSWHVYLFGRMRLSKGREERVQMEWKRKKAKELFLFLALQPRYMAVRETVIEVLQLGEELDKATQQLYVIIHQLKRTLERELTMKQTVIVRDGLIKLHKDVIDYVDVEHYLTLIRVADQLWQFDRDVSYEMYEQAYILYDELLPELPYIDWLESLREQVKQKQIQLLQKCIFHAEARHDWQHAEIYLRSWIAIKPYQEEAHAQLIALLIQQERYSEAQSMYDAWKDCCLIELDTTPSFTPSIPTKEPHLRNKEPHQRNKERRH